VNPVDEILSPSPVSFDGLIHVGVVVTPQINFVSSNLINCMKSPVLLRTEKFSMIVILEESWLRSSLFIEWVFHKGVSVFFELRAQ